MRQRDRERELSDELRSHIDLHTEDNIRAGMTPEESETLMQILGRTKASVRKSIAGAS